MPLSPALPQAAIDLVISFLLPIILPALGGEADAARALARHMVADYRPTTVRELRLAGEAVAFSLRSLAALGESAEPGIAADKRDNALKSACALSRSGHTAQRKLDLLQRADRAKAPPEPSPESVVSDEPVVPQPAAPDPAAPEPAASQPLAPEPVAHQEPPSDDTPASTGATPGADTQRAELTYQAALARLTLMQSRYKGAPPPHTQAAQQIKAQQRVVDMARMTLDKARRQDVQAATPPAHAAA